MNRLLSGLSACWFYIWGHILGLICYDKKFLKGKWFQNSHHGVGAIGWKWVTIDAIGKIFGHENKTAKFPVSQSCKILCPQNISFDPDDLNNFQGSGCYFQALGKISIGKGTYIAQNVGLITANHDLYNPDDHSNPKDIEIGKKCWIGMNSVLLPGVKLGDHTIVGAGSVVTKSFSDGYSVIAGNPAHIIKQLDKERLQ